MNPTQSASQELVRFVDDLKLAEIPRPILEKAKLHILDGLGTALACSELDKSKRIARALSKLDNGEGGGRTVWAYGFRAPANVATMINGTLVEALDYSDIHVRAGLHPTSVILPALLTVGDGSSDVSGTDLLEAYVAGCEVMIRLGETAPGQFHAHGFQPTSTIGVLGSALAVGKILKLSREELSQALSLASTLAFGSSLSVRVGSYFGGIDTGRASESGLVAALQASEGVRGIADDDQILEGRFGFLETHAGAGNYYLEPLTAGLGKSWEYAETFLKRYPTSYAHTCCLDATLKLRSEHEFAPKDIEQVLFGETSQNIALFAEPQTIKRSPRTIYDAKTSHYFLIASALVDSRIGIQTLSEEKLEDSTILQLARRIHYVPDERSHWIEVTLLDGTRWKSVQNDLVHSPEKMVVEKFVSNASTIMAEDRVQRLKDRVLSLENESRLDGLIQNLVA
jgi:2-methylcitrate dehydratase PrpD